MSKQFGIFEQDDLQVKVKIAELKKTWKIR